mmetsp:Transcript_110563/g.312790  ORF Transcript_110563/g.312790 Transcript_110563/m.312790 type:complete len:231 (-) Transcript_110563:10-702(-)
MMAAPPLARSSHRTSVATAVFPVLLLSTWELAAAAAGTEVGWGMIGAMVERDTDAYFARVRTDYKLRLQEEYGFYSIDMLVSPCYDPIRTGSLGENCCSDSNIAGCQHHPEVDAGPDLQIAYFQNAHIPTCFGTPFQNDPNCGTFIEVHRPGNPQILADVGIGADPFPNGYRRTRIATHRLCLGEHELWWVVRTRSGPYVQKKRSFQVVRPSCLGPAAPSAPFPLKMLAV